MDLIIDEDTRESVLKIINPYRYYTDLLIMSKESKDDIKEAFKLVKITRHNDLGGYCSILERHLISRYNINEYPEYWI